MPKRNNETAESVAAVCPWCALLCDDVGVAQRADQSLAVVRNGCRRAERGYARAPAPASVMVAGENVSLDAALDTAGTLFKRARNPLFAGLATDVDGMRACVNLAERAGAVLDHLHGDTLASMSRLLQGRGWYATTLSEVRNRADLVIIVDVDLNDRYENFPRRCLQPRAQMRTGKKKARETIYIGARGRCPVDLPTSERLEVGGDALSEVLRALLAGLRGHPSAAKKVGKLPRAALAPVVAAMQAASYCAIVFAPGPLGAQREPVIASILDIVDELNQHTRAAMLPLGGDDGAQSAVNTCAWLTGYPLRVAFGKTLRYEPQAYRSADLLANHSVDALLWIDAWGDHATPPAGAPREKTIVLSAREPEHVADYLAYIAVGTPGIDHFARLLRADSVVTLALPQQRDSGLPSVAGVLTRILDRL